jgi:hypothetical protein
MEDARSGIIFGVENLPENGGKDEWTDVKPMYCSMQCLSHSGKCLRYRLCRNNARPGERYCHSCCEYAECLKCCNTSTANSRYCTSYPSCQAFYCQYSREKCQARADDGSDFCSTHRCRLQGCTTNKERDHRNYYCSQFCELQDNSRVAPIHLPASAQRHGTQDFFTGKFDMPADFALDMDLDNLFS